MTHLVYILSDPVTGLIRYVGKTQTGLRRRLREHLRAARRGDRRHVCCWLRSLDEQPNIEVVEETADPVSLNDAERFYISYFRSLGFDLTNHTHGGEGTVGVRRNRTPEWNAKLGAAHRGKKISPQHRAAISSKLKGVSKGPFSYEHRKNISKARTGTAGRKWSELDRIVRARQSGGGPFIDQHGNRYESVLEAALETGLRPSNICSVLKLRDKSYRGFRFRYIGRP